MAPLSFKKRKLEQSSKPRVVPRKRIKKQTHYSSGSSDQSENDDAARDAPKLPKQPKASITIKSSLKQPRSIPKLKKEVNTQQPTLSNGKGRGPSEDENKEGDERKISKSDQEVDSSASSDVSDSGSNLDASLSEPRRTKSKRNDPDAFAASLSAILGSKLSTSKRDDPVLSRSKTALEASQSLADSKLEAKARRRIRDQKKIASEKGRVKDILLGDRTDVISTSAEVPEDGVSAAEIAQQEKRLRKTAQRGVVKLFNAVRAAQVRGEEEARKVRESGLVGSKRREEKVGEMGRKAFLDLVSGGG